MTREEECLLKQTVSDAWEDYCFWKEKEKEIRDGKYFPLSLEEVLSYQSDRYYGYVVLAELETKLDNL